MALQVTINLTDEEEQIMNDIVIDIAEWFTQGPFKEKIANHKKRIAELEIKRLIDEGAETVPTSVDALVAHYFAREGYQTRAQREAAAAQEE